MDLYDLKDRAMRSTGGKIRSKAFYRCGTCRSARVLKRELWLYQRPPRCACGAIDWRIDMSRWKEFINRTGPYRSCNCNGYHYPHRPGGGIHCVNWIKRCSDDDIYFLYGPEYC